MPRFICKLVDEDNTAYYLEWSTVVDAPLSFGMSLEEFTEYYRDHYGKEGMAYLGLRMHRVEAKGTSSMHEESLDNLISFNRAGKDETSLSKEQIIEAYCKKRDDKNLPLGKILGQE